MINTIEITSELSPMAIDVTKYSNAFKEIGDGIQNIAKSLIQNAVLPVAIIFCIVILAVQVAMIAYLKKEGRGSEIHSRVTPLVITIIILALLGTFTVWGYALM